LGIYNNPVSWTNILKNKYSLDVKNYSYGGTSAFWSLLKIKEHVDSVDVVIFVVTALGRLYTPNEEVSLSNINSVTHHLKTEGNQHTVLYQAALQYYLHLDNDDMNNFIHRNVVKEAIEIANIHNKRLILIPAFDDSVFYQNIFKISLNKISKRERYVNNVSMLNPITVEKQTMANHMTPVNNKILAEKIYQLLTSETTVSLDDFDFTKYADPSIYWNI
jgi:hypothetical protein